MMFLALEALYVQVRRIQTAGDGNPRLSAAVAVAAFLYPTIAAIVVTFTGAPVRPEGPAPVYFRVPIQYAAAFFGAGLVSIWFFDRRRLILDEEFKAMPTASSLKEYLLLAATATGMVSVLAYLSGAYPIAGLVVFAALMTAGSIICRRWR
jgi:hypothetical protein